MQIFLKLNKIIIQQLWNEAEQYMKNSADRGGCYPPRPKAEVDNTLRDLKNSSYPAIPEFRTSPLSKCIASMKTRRNVCTQAELWRWNKPRSRRWCSSLQVAWHMGVKFITIDQRNSCQPRKTRTTRLRMSWIRTRISFAILRTSLLCLRGPRSLKRVNLNLTEMDFDIERGLLGRQILIQRKDIEYCIFNYYYYLIFLSLLVHVEIVPVFKEELEI